MRERKRRPFKELGCIEGEGGLSRSVRGPAATWNYRVQPSACIDVLCKAARFVFEVSCRRSVEGRGGVRSMRRNQVKSGTSWSYSSRYQPSSRHSGSGKHGRRSTNLQYCRKQKRNIGEYEACSRKAQLEKEEEDAVAVRSHASRARVGFAARRSRKKVCEGSSSARETAPKMTPPKPCAGRRLTREQKQGNGFRFADEGRIAFSGPLGCLSVEVQDVVMFQQKSPRRG